MSNSVSSVPQVMSVGYPGQARPTTKPRLQLIQVSRGVAALLVLLFHVNQLSETKLHQPFCFGLFRFGSAGVDFFFVLSGFIIFFIHHTDIGRRDRLKPFVLKRLIRVYPLYWIVTLVLLPVYFLIPTFGTGHESRLPTILQSLFLIPQEHPPILTVGWSLGYEIFFYAMFSLVILIPFRFSCWIISIWLFGSILNIALESIFLIKLHFILQFLFSFHTLEFLLGCLAAYLVLCQCRCRAPSLLIAGITLFLLVGVGQSYHLSQLHPLLGYGLPSFLILLGAGSLDLKGFANPPLLFSYLGDASYSIYLTHYPVLSAALKVVLGLNLISLLGYGLTFTVMLVNTLAIGCLIYSRLEKPLTLTIKKHLLI